MQQRYILQILLLAQHVSGNTMPIIRSSRVLYSGCCLFSEMSTPDVFLGVKQPAVTISTSGRLSRLRISGDIPLSPPIRQQDGERDTLNCTVYEYSCNVT